MKIEKGDKVYVSLFMGEQTEKGFEGIVQYVPGQPGESWIFSDAEGNIRYIPNFVQIIKRP